MKVSELKVLLQGCNNEADVCVFVNDTTYAPLAGFILKPSETAGPSDIVFIADPDDQELPEQS